jgi:hypothetical protein
MKLEPNMGRTYRVFCVFMGAVLIIVPFALTMPSWVRIVVPILGVIGVATGLTGGA